MDDEETRRDPAARRGVMPAACDKCVKRAKAKKGVKNPWAYCSKPCHPKGKKKG